MNTLVPIEFYTPLYYNFLLLIVVLVFAQTGQSPIYNSQNLRNKSSLGMFLLVFIILYMGLRPVSGRYFGDMLTYSVAFERYALGDAVVLSKDVYFEAFMKFCSWFMPATLFFLVCAFLYVYPLYKAAQKLFGQYWFYGFFMLVISLSFWAYGTNGIRNGIASSIFLMAITRSKKAGIIALCVMAVLFHKSMLILIASYILTNHYKNSKVYFWFWLLAIPLSLMLGGVTEGFFLNFGFGEEERLQGYLVNDEDLQAQFSNTGFRWDFVLYSALGIFAGWYFIFKKKFQDVFYSQLFNIYLVVNGFWILVIRANFSNRFAYLSWFLLGLVIIYPLLKMEFFKKQHVVVGRIIFLYFLFTYILNVLAAAP